MNNRGIFLALSAVVFVILFQNCAKTNFTSTEVASVGSEGAPAVVTGPAPSPTPIPPPETVEISVVKPFSCLQFVEIIYDSSQILDIPERDNRGLCYVVKIISKAIFNKSVENMVVDSDVLSSNYEFIPNSNYQHPYVLGAQEVRMKLEGERSIKLSGGKDDTTSITVDNFILVGIAPASMSGNPSYYKAFGTSDSALSNTNYVKFKNSEVSLKPLAPGGISTIAPFTLEGLVELKREYSLDVRGLDAGYRGEISDIYILFQ